MIPQVHGCMRGAASWSTITPFHLCTLKVLNAERASGQTDRRRRAGVELAQMFPHSARADDFWRRLFELAPGPWRPLEAPGEVLEKPLKARTFWPNRPQEGGQEAPQGPNRPQEAPEGPRSLPAAVRFCVFVCFGGEKFGVLVLQFARRRTPRPPLGSSREKTSQPPRTLLTL